ncbi:SpdA protein [Streptomyces cavernicola]|uniref:SpdA protein n=1 Tax=Streptomyces cavernicola TaxID=3043613 RepID=A0ABT6SLA6_9ACTN|nr:SpdA protein [Streptomyces sp. B-S-A6]MDI3408854.1 SpdA protein [Streptomyces sp. B-S-A6]
MGEERVTQRTVTVVMATIAALAFVFSFGNVWSLALRLGVPRPIAPLIAPMVDLSVLGLLVGLRHLSLKGVDPAELKGAVRLMHLSGLLTLALNIAEPIAAEHYGRAALDAVAPLLLLGWGAVGPQMLRHFHTLTAPEPRSVTVEIPGTEPVPETVPAPDSTPTRQPAESAAPAPSSAPSVPASLLEAARTIAAQHHTATGQTITPAQLKTRLGVPMPLASAAHAQL